MMRSIVGWACKYIFVILVSIAISACSAVEIATSYVVDDYCSQPVAARLTVRALVNAGASPNHVEIDCAIDHRGQVFFTDSE